MSQNAKPSFDVKSLEEFPPLPAPRQVNASLQDPTAKSKKPANTAADTPPTGYYVIIGCGLAAVLNHTTLRQAKKGKDRLAHPTTKDVTLPVMHLGFEDPWGNYHAHGMGQPPYLLTMPGYHDRPSPDADKSAIRSGMRSTEFAGITKKEWDLLRDKFKFEHREAWAAVIQPRGEGEKGKTIDANVLKDLEEEGLSGAQVNQQLGKKYPDSYPPYRILVVSPEQKLDLVYAHKIDICVGAGRPTIPKPSESAESCWGGRTQLWVPPSKWNPATAGRRVVNAPEALCRQTPWTSAERMCVFGAGGIGLNMVERAEDVGCHLDWLPNPMPGVGRPAATSLHRTFNLARNDTVLKHPMLPKTDKSGKAMEPGESSVRDDKFQPTRTSEPLYPCKDEWRFAWHTDILNVQAVGGGIRIKIGKATVQGAPPDGAKIVDAGENSTDLTGNAFPFSKWYAEKFTELSSEFYDKQIYSRLFVSTGLLNQDALGTPDTLARAIEFKRLEVNGRTVGLESSADAGLVRCLGAAAVMHPKADFAMNKHDGTNKFFGSLPYSAVQPGFIYAGATIAAANGWFDKPNENRNVNTVEQGDLIKMLEEDMNPDDAKKLGEAIVAKRRLSNGYRDLDAMKTLVTSDWPVKQLPGMDRAISKLFTSYPPALEFWK